MVMVFSVLLIVITVLGGLGHKTNHFVNEFVAEIHGGEDLAKTVASNLGFYYIGQIHELPNFYKFGHDEVQHRHKREAADHIKKINEHPLVVWVEQQQGKKRAKRGTFMSRRYAENNHDEERIAYQDLGDSFNDPYWPKQFWYMRDSHQTPENSSNTAKVDLRVLPAWQKGYTGKGIVITILDDGLEWNHTDIERSYAAAASYDLNDDDTDPFPRYDATNENRHGTRCAGVISMTSKNSVCGVGIAPDAKVGGVRMLDGTVTDRIEAQAIAFNVKNIDIMSASWGPTDNGRMVDGPGRLGKLAFDKGIIEGRRGLGIIYIWASGNGGSRGDNCECDGYVSSPYTLSISSASMHMRSPFYVEKCPSTMATTFSSGSFQDSRVVSTDLHNKCTDTFTGTSAAAPQAAAMAALTLEANPNLTWRDMQHIVVWTASPYPLYNNPGWMTNAAGFKINHRFGFGLLNAIEMVEAAEDWENVGKRRMCDVTQVGSLPRTIVRSQRLTVEILASGCQELNYLEHVELIITAKYSKRGALSIDLISPEGTRVSMMRPREYDYNSIGYVEWPFMSVQTWGENPHGLWIMEIWEERDPYSTTQYSGELVKVTLRLWGTKEMPPIMAAAKGNRRLYNFPLKEIVHEREGDAENAEEQESTHLFKMFSNMLTG